MVSKEKKLLIYVFVTFLIIFLIWLIFLPKVIGEKKQDKFINSFKDITPKLNNIFKSFKTQLKNAFNSSSTFSPKGVLTNEEIENFKQEFLKKLRNYERKK